MIIKTITESDFIDAFERMNRANNFSFEGLTALYEHLDDLSDETGIPLELDVIAICCQYTEYTAAELIAESDFYRYVYEDAIKDGEDEESARELVIEEALTQGAIPVDSDTIIIME